MTPVPQIELELLCDNPAVMHLSQVLSGFAILNRLGHLRVAISRQMPFQPHNDTMRAVLNHHVNVVYDLADDHRIKTHHAEWCDIYFKRSYSRTHHSSDTKIQPFGLNYQVYADGDWRGLRALWALRYLPVHTSWLTVVRLSRYLSFLFQTNEGAYNASLENFESRPRPSEKPRVLLLTRMYDPEAARPSRREECRVITGMRASCIRELRKALGDAFVGGFVPSQAAVRHYPDCVAPQALVQKHTYLRLMKSADICVTSAGLGMSNGWRLAEYVAASKPIVSERLHYEVPGGFCDGVNYLAFQSAQECAERVLYLLHNGQARQAMAHANTHYYRSHVRPDAICSRTVEHALTKVRLDLHRPLSDHADATGHAKAR